MTSKLGIKPAAAQSAGPTANRRAPALMLPVFRLPLVLYRLGLGSLMGTRFLCLTHIGRRSGRTRQTILAVLSFDPSTREIKTVSAWSGSDWFRNIQAKPAIEVQCGLVRYKPTQRYLAPEEIAGLFIDYRRKHRLFSSIVCRIPGWNADATYEEFLRLARTLRGVAFRPLDLPGRAGWHLLRGEILGQNAEGRSPSRDDVPSPRRQIQHCRMEIHV